MALDPDLLRILACPRCKDPVRPTPSGDGLGCIRCRVIYPVRDDIPVMIVEEALAWTPQPQTGPE